MESYEKQNKIPTFLLPESFTLPKDPLPSKTVCITGIGGQDGVYLTSYLLFKNQDYDYIVHGIVRKGNLNLNLLLEIQ